MGLCIIFNFISLFIESSGQSIIGSSNGDVLLRTDADGFVEHDNEDNHTNPTENETISHPSNAEDILEPTGGEGLEDPDMEEVIGELTGGVSLGEMNNREMVNEESLLDGVSRKRKSTASLKRLGKRVKKKFRVKDEKKVIKKKQVEDEEKENNEDQYNEGVMSTQDNMDGEDGDSGETSAIDQLGKSVIILFSSFFKFNFHKERFFMK